MQMQRWLSGQDRLEWLHPNGNLHAGTVHRHELQQKGRTPMQMQLGSKRLGCLRINLSFLNTCFEFLRMWTFGLM